MRLSEAKAEVGRRVSHPSASRKTAKSVTGLLSAVTRFVQVLPLSCCPRYAASLTLGCTFNESDYIKYLYIFDIKRPNF